MSCLVFEILSMRQPFDIYGSGLKLVQNTFESGPKVVTP